MKKFRHVHFVGIKGVAMTALAIVAKEQGSYVTGSDIEEEFPTSAVLSKFKITPLPGFKKENIVGKPDLVVVTGAHGGMSNPEAQAAKSAGLKVLMHGQALGEFMKGKKGIAVAGSHGKTTCAAMVAHILINAGLDPSFAVGCGEIKSLTAPGHAGRGNYFVVEADEYVTDPGQDPTPRFFHLSPLVAVITNIEYDHPDAYSNLEQLKQAFLTFAKKIPSDGLLVAGIDNENVRAILSSLKSPILTFGFSPRADFQISRVSFGRGRTWFRIKHKKIDLGQFSLSIPGRHNATNAVAASIVSSFLGISWEKIRQNLATFLGTKRRFEEVGEREGIKFFDDYAHHPTEIKATLEAARAWFPRRKIVCIFQPHTFSRTKALMGEFSKCFTQASQVIITDIYPSAREKPEEEINSKILVNEIQKYHKNAIYIGKMEEAANFVGNQANPGTVILTMGAGDIYKIHKYFLSQI
ncbi:MAG: UDP-N-acetylmuramate--L-alanine ligase [Microgenomates group bacterium LiPW_16]|nr:MAG: UDP-N-acetylmuramate--L-alanine ligase [Microgenomates group bacterium LiPW_16]